MNCPIKLSQPKFTLFIQAFFVALVSGFLSLHIGAQGLPQLQLPKVSLSAGMHLIQAQLAQDFEQRQIGLMWRKEMPQNEGMLFVFDQPDRFCFWMKNTLIPLSAAFIDDTGAIVNIADMQPGSTDTHCAQKPVRFVLEMNQGWFQKRGFGTGARIGGLMR